MPAPPAKSAVRAVAVLTHLTAHPQSAFTLSEIGTALGVSLASLSPVLEALAEAGYLVRHPRHRTYQLGPALVAVGQAAAQRHPVVEHAREEMRRLVEEVGGECIGSAVVREDILILVMEGRPSALTRGLAVGQRVPLAPPLGQVFLAWSGPAAVEAWLTRTFGAELPTAARAELVDALDRVRRQGCAVQLTTGPAGALVHTPPASGRVPYQQLVAAVSALGDARVTLARDTEVSYEAVHVVAPVFGDAAQVVFALTLLLSDTVTGSRVLEVVGQVTDSATRLSRRIGGRPPSHDGPS